MRYTSLVFLLLVSATTSLAGQPVDYTRDVFPILETHCLGCHTEGDAEGGFVMESHADLMAGGDSGAAITAGVPSSSRMFLMAAGKLEPVMPPDGEEGLDEEQLAILAAWIEQGASGPDGDTPIKRTLRTPSIKTSVDAEQPVTAIAISNDAKLQAIARFGHVQVKQNGPANGSGGQVVSTLQGDLGKVNSIEFNHDGSQVLVASGLTGAYGLAAIFNTDSGKLVTEMVGHRDTLYAAIFSPDQTQVATAGYDQDIILWDVKSGEPIRNFSGHNGAIFDLAFSADGKTLVSACADETIKVWNATTGQRLDTLGQPEGEVFSVAITNDNKHIVAGSSDNRLRVWQFVSRDKPAINRLVATRFIDESPIVNFAKTPDGKAIVVLSEAGNLKLVRTDDWTIAATLPPLPGAASDVTVTPDGSQLLVSLMSGGTAIRNLPSLVHKQSASSASLKPVYLNLGPLTKLDESAQKIPRGAEVSGTIDQANQSDVFSFRANRGEVWAIDVDPTKGSRIDPTVAVMDDQGDPVLRVRLQAIRDSYFTFRGKDSKQTNDFRMFAWQEMNLNDYLYAAGEVSRLFMHPRGPDSGFNVYPNEAERWTYFGTSQATHALGEPAYVVRPLGPNETAVANGLPVFDIFYENDDDPMRLSGKSSRLLFTAPADGQYQIHVADTRGEGGDDYGYVLKLRAAEPCFKPIVVKPKADLRPGTGREVVLKVDRMDGFDGPVTFEVEGLPAAVRSNFPVTIQPGQRYAHGLLWVSESADALQPDAIARLTARAKINGVTVERDAGMIEKLTLGERPEVIPSLQPIDREVAEDENWTLTIRRGETATARVMLRRKEGFTKEVPFGKENAGRNASFGVYVDNIGLNGLLVVEGANEREFFLTADPNCNLGKRTFFLTAGVAGGVTTQPITVEIVP